MLRTMMKREYNPYTGLLDFLIVDWRGDELYDNEDVFVIGDYLVRYLDLREFLNWKFGEPTGEIKDWQDNVIELDYYYYIIEGDFVQEDEVWDYFDKYYDFCSVESMKGW